MRDPDLVGLRMEHDAVVFRERSETRSDQGGIAAESHGQFSNRRRMFPVEEPADDGVMKAGVIQSHPLQDCALKCATSAFACP